MIKNRNFIESFKCAFRGIFVTIKTQRNMRFHLAVAIAISICGAVANVGEINFLLIAIAIALVITAEIFNSAIENAVDLSTAEFNLYAKDAKDMAAGGVLFSAIAAIVIGCVVFFKGGRFLLLFTRIFSSWVYVALSVIYIILSIIFVFCRKN